MIKKYDSTVARIAGNIAGHYIGNVGSEDTIAKWSVSIARKIVAEVERTEPVTVLNPKEVKDA